MNVVLILTKFDAFLAKKTLSFEGIVIGGAALALLRIISRETKDCDVLDPELPQEIADAALEFAQINRAEGEFVIDGWFNNGPRSLVNVLPKGWEHRIQKIYTGKALQLFTLSRLDLLRAKFFALCDRGIDLADCIALNPALEEVLEILPWVKEQDANEQWPEHVHDTVQDLTRRLGYEL